MALVVALAMGVMDVACAASFRLASPASVPIGTDTGSNVAIGDVDGDGRDDVMVTSSDQSYQHNLFIFLQRNDGALAAPLKFALPGAFNYLNPVKVADLDGDDVGEILVGTQYGVTVLRWGGLAFQSADYANRYGCEYLVFADINGDGDADVFCHDWKANAALLYGDGAGGLSTAIDMTTSAGNYGTGFFKGMRLKDVTGDGKPDLVITASNVNSFFVYANNGFGAFFPGVAYPHPLGFQVWPAAVEVIDVDTDGIDEVVTVNPYNRPDATMYVYRRNPLGYLTLSESIATHDSTTALLAHDIDRDGAEDLLAGHFEFNAVGRYMAGIGMLGSELLSDLPGFMGHSNGLALGDINGDGHTDLAGATTSGLKLLYGYRPKPDNDFNGDYVSDVLWRNPVTGLNVVWKSANNATPQAMNAVGSAWSLQATGDFNGDGKYDVFWRHGGTGQNVIWRSANAATPQAVTSIGLDWAVVGAGDFDGDGKSDLLWRNATTGANAIWKSGNYATQQVVNPLGDVRWQVAGLGDFDGDGKSDILWRHSASGNNAIWRSGKSASPQAMTGMPVNWNLAGVGDFDDDGRDDIVWRHAGTGANAIWRSASSATSQAVVGVTNLDWKIAAVGDYDGDGNSDLLWRNAATGANVIWRSANNATPKGVTGVTNLDWRIAR